MPTIEQARSWYRRDDPVHGFDHVERVVRLAEELARQAGADAEIVRAAALLHDAAGAHPEAGEGRHDHQDDSAAAARRVLADEGWPEER
ncbi:MAG: HD domain-containing protein, partial [Chloroflexi bacterium]|nr:HD domain-containing protein [Chloroflexota bacterium]